MPSSQHIHKSMLLRGVAPPTPALNRHDVEELKGKMRNSGRSHGGVPLGRQYNDGGGRGRINYGPDSRRDRPGPDRGPYQGGYQNRNNAYPPPPIPPPGWVPPPPGFPGFGGAYPGFGNGPPPIPPPGQANGGGGYGGNYGGYAPPPPPPPAYNGSYGNYGNQYNRPPPSYNGRDRDQRSYGGGGRGGYRGGGRDYR